MNYPEDHPLNETSLGRNEDGSYDVIVRMTIRLRDEIGLRSDLPGMLEFEHAQQVDSTGAIVGYALNQYLTGMDTSLLTVEKGHVFAGNGSNGFFQNHRGKVADDSDDRD